VGGVRRLASEQAMIVGHAGSREGHPASAMESGLLTRPRLGSSPREQPPDLTFQNNLGMRLGFWHCRSCQPL
jgi:hypothetical protein